MQTELNVEFSFATIRQNLNRITNQIYKLLPMREEGSDWHKPLQTLIIELRGMVSLLPDQVDLFTLLCKLEAMKTLEAEEDFLLFRKTIFECLGLLDMVKSKCQD